MKKELLFLVMAFCFTACSKDLNMNEDSGVSKEITLTANMDQFNDAAKTAVSGRKVFWSTGDQIEVYSSASEHATFTLVAGEGTTNGTFVGTLTGKARLAYYPADGCVEYLGSEKGFTVTIPSTQIYSEESIGDRTFPMIGTISDGNISFKNAFGFVKFSLKGSGKVSSIVLTDIDNVVAGTYRIAPDGTATKYKTSDNKSAITLACPQPVELNNTTATDFCIALPSGSLSGGFYAEVFNEKGHPAEVLFSKKSNTINRNTCVAMPVKSGLEMSIPEGYTEAVYVEQNGSGPHINTGVSASNDFYVSSKSFVDTTSMRSSGEDPVVTVGSRTSSASFYAGGFLLNKGWWFRCGSNDFYYKKPLVTTAESRVILTETSYVCIANDARLTERAASVTDWPSAPIFLFSASNGNGTHHRCANAKIYYCVMIKDGTVVRNFVPCLATAAGIDINGNDYAAGAAGYYDKENGHFYSNDGTGSLIAVMGVDPLRTNVISNDPYVVSAEQEW